jgi:hypothetical protein
MANLLDGTNRMIALGTGVVDLQEWHVERLADSSFEYHSYVGLNYTRGNNEPNGTKGAVWLLMRLSDPGSVGEVMTYRAGRTGLPGSGNDLLLTEWNNRAISTYYRYDQLLQQFFS